jgi:hypothetical protein
LPTALSRQRLNRDAFLSTAQFAFEKIPYISPMRVSLQLPISVAPTPTRQFRDQAHHKRLRPECNLQLLCSAALCHSACNIDPRIASPKMLLDNFSPMTGATSPNRIGVVDGGKDQYGRAA